MNFGLIIIGDEILSGKRQDKHLPKVIELLAERGLSLSWVRYVGDEPERITADLKYAFDSGDVVFYVAASVPRQTTTQGNAPRALWAQIWCFILRPAT